MTITDLIERLEHATGPDRGLDGRIAWALGWRFNGFIWDGDPVGGPDTVEDFNEWDQVGGCWIKPGDDKFYGDSSLSKHEMREGEMDDRWANPPCWTASVDASLDLLRDILPGWHVENLCEWEATVLRDRGEWMCDLVSTQKPREPRLHVKCAHAVNPAIALTVAILKAKDAHGT
jgi:hypothetical protein